MTYDPRSDEELRQQLMEYDLFQLKEEQAKADAMRRDEAFKQQQIEEKAQQTKEFFAQQDRQQQEFQQQLQEQATQHVQEQAQKEFWDQKRQQDAQAGMEKELASLQEAARQAQQQYRTDLTQGICRDDVAAQYNKQIEQQVGAYSERLADLGTPAIDATKKIDTYKEQLQGDVAPEIEAKAAKLHQEQFPEYQKLDGPRMGASSEAQLEANTRAWLKDVDKIPPEAEANTKAWMKNPDALPEGIEANTEKWMKNVDASPEARSDPTAMTGHYVDVPTGNYLEEKETAELAERVPDGMEIGDNLDDVSDQTQDAIRERLEHEHGAHTDGGDQTDAGGHAPHGDGPGIPLPVEQAATQAMTLAPGGTSVEALHMADAPSHAADFITPAVITGIAAYGVLKERVAEKSDAFFRYINRSNDPSGSPSGPSDGPPIDPPPPSSSVAAPPPASAPPASAVAGGGREINPGGPDAPAATPTVVDSPPPVVTASQAYTETPIAKPDLAATSGQQSAPVTSQTWETGASFGTPQSLGAQDAELVKMYAQRQQELGQSPATVQKFAADLRAMEPPAPTTASAAPTASASTSPAPVTAPANPTTAAPAPKVSV